MKGSRGWLARCRQQISVVTNDYWRWLHFSTLRIVDFWASWLRFWATRFVEYCIWLYSSLSFHLFLQALPAIVVGVGALVVLAFAAFTPAQEVEARYLDRAHSSTRGKDYQVAQTCFERLSQMREDGSEVVYEWALMARDAGQLDRCRILMNQLAPAGRVGHGKAHFWIAKDILSAPQQTAQGQQLAESHLLRALDAGGEEKELVHLVLGEFCIAKKMDEEAKAHFLIAANTKPEARMHLMVIHARQGDLVNARREGKLAAGIFSAKAKADLFNHYARVRWADAVTFLEDFPQALAILQEGLTVTGEPFYRTRQAQVYAKWFDHLGRKDDTITAERLAMLDVGLRCDPKNIFLLDRVLGILGPRHKHRPSPAQAAFIVATAASNPRLVLNLWAAGAQAETDAARAILRRMLAEGQATSQVHFSLGIDAWERGLTAEARSHWELAHLASPEGPGVPNIANNLAWLLYKTSPNELDKALELANLAVDKAPNRMDHRDTRGYILIKMGKFKEAVPDLEAALTSSHNKLELHRTLAEVYDRLQLPDLAAEHQRLALALSKKSAKQP